MAERDSAAWRRRRRRLPMYWRYEHHSYDALRGQTTATRTREGEEGDELHGDDPGDSQPPFHRAQHAGLHSE